MIDKIVTNEDNDAALKSFLGDSEFSMFLFAIPEGTSKVSFVSEAPSPDKIKKKCVLIIRARSKKELPGGGELDEKNIA